ncbi:MAG: hypothetical protein KDA92_05830 [Planctomycetales bacterium]|nr:hypothetical protein [Planctomycetales bacterium]
MQSHRLIKLLCLGLCLAMTSTHVVNAKSPWQWVSFRRGTKSASFELTEKSGPWLIYTASFAGEGAELEAHALATELRDRYHLSAYVHSHEFDFTDEVEGIGFNMDRTPKRMRYDKAGSFEEFAVLVGDFSSVDDTDLQKTLSRIKYAQPECLSKSGEKTTRRFAGLREFQRRINQDDKKKRKGPLRTAFATPNPMLPREFFAPKGVDSEVVKWNEGVKYSLLDCPGKFSVRVATFGGNVVIDQQQVADIEKGGASMKSQLEVAAMKANRLTLALRKQGIEAYEFHDRHESFVTIGHFDWALEPDADGKPRLNPEVMELMQRYAPTKTSLVGNNGQPLSGIKPKLYDGIALDVQPFPVEVPRRSIAMDYTRR